MSADVVEALPSPSGAPTPLYYRLREVLRARISSGELLVGQLFPTELELSERYGVSRTTVREAILGLVHEGLLVRKQGKGTFVAAQKMERELAAPTGFIEEMGARGLQPGARTLSTEVMTLDGRDAELLGSPEGTRAYRIVRLRLGDDEPYSLETNIFPYDLGLRLAQEKLDEVGYYPLLEERYGIQLAGAEQTVEARPAAVEEADLLRVRRRATVVVLERVTTDISDRKIELMRGVYRADRFRYRVHLTRQPRGHVRAESDRGGKS
jgi:GntR family transcriptional regulator